jgi:hypothetical protein
MIIRTFSNFAFLVTALCLVNSGKAVLAADIDAHTISQLWVERGDIRSLDLYYGYGAKEREPRGPYTFEKEDMDGTNPKFVVRDARGVKWKVKLGSEVQAETVATRLMWAAGYHVTEDYYLPQIQVQDLPKLNRGQSQVQTGGVIEKVRLKRESKESKKVGEWEWRTNPFTGTPQFDGLRVMMAFINNWDLKDINNAVFDRTQSTPDGGTHTERVYLVSDLGASFGTNNMHKSHEVSKGNVKSFEQSHFLLKSDPTTASFETPASPQFIIAFNPKEYSMRAGMKWIGRDIPLDHVRWLSKILNQLSPQQLREAFRAGGFPPAEMDGFSNILQKRLAQLDQL